MSLETIIKIEKRHYTGKVYNLEVEPNDSVEDDQYYVNANNGLVVHNCHPRDNIALRWLAKELNLGYDMFESIMTAREQQAENMAKAILTHGNNIWFSSDSYKPGTDLVDGSSSLLVQHYVKKHGGQLVHGIDNPVEVIVRVHESDEITADDKTIIFDPWRTYPTADNVVYYGK